MHQKSRKAYLLIFQNEYDNYQRRSRVAGPSYTIPINGVNDKTKEQKYGEDIMALHEAYQVLLVKV